MIERFEKFWIPEPNSGCWLWLGALHTGGYGMFSVGSRTDKSKRMGRAHCVSWEIYRGAAPVGTKVLHRCDMPICVNPDHLWLGTQGDNARDRVSKFRHGGQKITRAQAAYIRAISGRTNRSIADEYGVHEATIRDIRKGRTFHQERDQ